MALRAQRGKLRLVEGEAHRTEAERLGEAARPSDVAQTPVPASATPLVASTSLHHAAATAGAAPAPRPTVAVLATLQDAQLVALGRLGERRALEVLYRRHAAFAIQLATRIEGSARDVEDIVHDAFLRAFERLGDLADPASFRAWLGAIVVHAVRSRLRRGRLMAVLGMGKSSEPVDLDALASPDASPHVRAQIAQIYALLRTLPTDDRIAWTLRAIDGHDLEEAARLCGCSLATVKRRISRTQRFLDDHFVDSHATAHAEDDAGAEGSEAAS
jgi:RNA polymerase sigma-70 factor (ECF subfamily)